MKKTNKIFIAIIFHLTILITIGIAGTYLSDYLIEIKWFGDEKVNLYNNYSERYYEHNNWGARHYWYNFGVALFFLTSLSRSIVSINEIANE